MAQDPKANGSDPNGLQTVPQQILWKRWDELTEKANRSGLNIEEIDELIRLRDALGLQDRSPLF